MEEVRYLQYHVQTVNSPLLSFISLDIRVLRICWHIKTTSYIWQLPCNSHHWFDWLIRDLNFKWLITWPSQSCLSSCINAIHTNAIFKPKDLFLQSLISIAVSICFSLEVLATSSVDESRSKSIKAWSSSKDFVLLESSEIEPTKK